MQWSVIVPSMPDMILRRIFELLTYKEMCRLEIVCKRWRKLILWMFRRDILELTVEQLLIDVNLWNAMAQLVRGLTEDESSLSDTSEVRILMTSVTYKTISVSQQVPFKRLSVSCPFEATHFLSGVLRRSRLHVRKLSCDLRFLAYLDNLRCDREESRRYWSNVEELWLVITKLSDDITRKFLSIEPILFLNLLEMTVQIHEGPMKAANTNRVLSALTETFPNVRINMELHANCADDIYAQLSALSPMKLNKLKLICVAYEPARISLTSTAQHLHQRNITIRNFFVRDWCIGCEPHECLFHNALNTFRISSCDIENVHDLSTALLKTVVVGQKQNHDGDAELKDEHSSVERTAKTGDKRTSDQKGPFIARVEVAGQCQFRGLEYLNQKAHVEFERIIVSKIPSIDVDCSDIYYYD